MRKAVLGALVGAGLVMAAVASSPEQSEVFAQRTAPYGPTEANSELIALSMAGETYQQVTLIDPKQQVMSVYHIELATGVIELKCVRQIRWDLQIADYNGKGLLPREIQSQLQLR